MACVCVCVCTHKGFQGVKKIAAATQSISAIREV